MAVRSEMKLDTVLASRALSRDQLVEPCKQECLDKMALKLTRWKILCPFLGLSSEEEEKILKSHQKNSHRRSGMLNLWREKLGDEATYLRLITVFDEAKMSGMIINLLDWWADNEKVLSTRKRQLSRVPKLDDIPKPQHLIRVVGKSGKEIVIRDRIMFDWEELYTQLNCSPSAEETADRIEEIRRNSHHQDDEACREVLLIWLSGTGNRKPVSWATFICLLRDIKQNELANELEEELSTS